MEAVLLDGVNIEGREIEPQVVEVQTALEIGSGKAYPGVEGPTTGGLIFVGERSLAPLAFASLVLRPDTAKGE